MKTIIIWLMTLIISVGLFVSGVIANWLHNQLNDSLAEPNQLFTQWFLPGPAVMMLFVIIALTSIMMIRRQFTTQHSQIVQVLKSLINRDTSLSHASAPNIQPLLTEVQEELARSRNAAEIQANYLKALIAQLDIAVLEVTDEGYIDQSNPAAERLLGLSFIHAWQETLSYNGISTTENSVSTPTAHQDAENTQEQHNIENMRKLLQQHKASSRGELIWHYPNHKETFIYTLIQSFNQGKQRTLLTLQSIEKQLVAHEVKAHQQLVKVLTHEIANSIAPMVSLTQSAESISADMLNNGVKGSEDLVEALATVSRRGQHLTQFIQSFKALSTPVNTRLEATYLRPQVEEVLLLMQEDCASVEVSIDISPTFEVMVDSGLFEQVLINLIKNACEATLDQARRQIRLVAQHIDQIACLDIIDNGSGISEQAAASIFVPFFTTKSDGTGIGLPLARSLMLSQGGNLLLLNESQHGQFRCVFG